jgi:hypothetical protein
MENSISCPSCGTAINVNEVLYHQLEGQIKKDYDRKSAEREKDLQGKLELLQTEKELLAQEKEKLKEVVDAEVQTKLKTEKTKLEELLRNKIEQETSEQVEQMQKELGEQSEKLKELNKSKAEIERLKREKDQLREDIALEKEKEFSDKLREEQKRIQQVVEEANTLKLKEREQIIEGLKGQLEEARKKAEQGSMQLQGEVQELEIESILRGMHPLDEITEIKKGQRGADIIQVVRNMQGTACGKIYYESKRTKHFENGWLQKLKEDNLEAKADILVIITEAMPDGVDKFVIRDGVWICSFREIRSLTMALRYALVQVQAVTITQQGKETKMELLYNYLTSQEFRGAFEAIIDGFNEIREGHAKEKQRIQAFWKEREKQLERVLGNAVGFYGSLKGIAGASIPDIKLLESDQSKLLLEE